MGESAIFGRQLGEQVEGIGWPDGMREASRRALELGKDLSSKFETRLTLPGAADSIAPRIPPGLVSYAMVRGLFVQWCEGERVQRNDSALKSEHRLHQGGA